MKNYFLILALMLSGMSLVSCGDKKVDEPNTFAGVYYDERTSDREYIEQVANTVLGFIKPGEQRDAVRALNTFANLCESYDFPDNFGNISRSARALADVIDGDDYLSLSRAANTFVYNLAGFKGMYQANPDSYRWSRIEDREDVLFRYWIDGTEYNVTVSGNGSGGSVTVTEGTDKYTVDLPKTLDFTLLRGSLTSSTSLITSKIQTDLRDGQSVNVVSSTRVGSMEVVLDASGSNSKLTDKVTLYRHDPSTMVRTLILSASTDLNGAHLCSVQAWKNAVDREDLSTMMSSASTTLMLYGSIQIKANVSDIKTFVDNVSDWWDSYDYSNPKEMAQRAASALKSTVTAEVRYYGDNPDKLRATLGWEAYQCDDWADYEEWEVRPTITFTKDNSTYDFGSYFGNSHFLSVENSIKSIISSYRSYWK